MRVVSLHAAATEIVCALGAGDRLVGRSHECDNPGWVRRLPACTRPAFDIEVASGAIDAEVRRRLAAGEPLYHVDSRRILDLAPDVIIAQAHCEVCAVTPSDLVRTGCRVPGRVVALTAGSLAGIWDDVANIARALDLVAAGEALIIHLRARMAAVSAAVRDRPTADILMLEWVDPIFAMANWAPELAAAANGRMVLGSAGVPSRAIAWQDVLDADPETLLVAPCGFDLARATAAMSELAARRGWRELKAVRADRVAVADGNRYFNRAGVTVVESVEILAALLHGTPAPNAETAAGFRRYPG